MDFYEQYMICYQRESKNKIYSFYEYQKNKLPIIKNHIFFPSNFIFFFSIIVQHYIGITKQFMNCMKQNMRERQNP